MPPSDHASHPVDCFRRAIAAAKDMHAQLQDAKRASRALDPVQDGPSAARAIIELAHLAVMDDLGLLTPVYEALQFTSFTPDQAEQIAHAHRSWDERGNASDTRINAPKRS